MPTFDSRKITDGNIDGRCIKKIKPSVPVHSANGKCNVRRLLSTDAHKRRQQSELYVITGKMGNLIAHGEA